MRILQCPDNIAGQPWEYAQGLQNLGIESTCLILRENPVGYKCDISIPIGKYRYGKSIRLFSNLLRCIKNYDVFHFHFGATLLPENRDLPLLKMLGKKMVMNYWGDDVRQPSISSRYNKYALIENDENVIVRNLKRASKYIDVAIVPDYELYENINGYFRRIEIIRQALDPDNFNTRIPALNTLCPKIVHAPSYRGVKGTEFVQNTIKKLESEGYKFEFVLVEGVSHQEALQIYEKADIIVDQLLGGTHGIFSMEAMAIGKPVICYIRDDLISKYPQGLPLVSANPDNIYDKLKTLIENPRLRAELGAKGREYVEQFHDSKKIAQQLISLYESL